jgi:hypothetical protein
MSINLHYSGLVRPSAHDKSEWARMLHQPMRLDATLSGIATAALRHCQRAQRYQPLGLMNYTMRIGCGSCSTSIQTTSAATID